jgi:tRNA/tmRNA/rRNA uracil-C5-methylase (TrmA/RlmC/RlmD family)
MLTAGSEVVLVPEKAVAGGSMLARHEGRVVLVRGAIPGERIRARIEHVARDVLHGAVVDVIEPHRDRREPHVDPACGGNTFAHIAYRRQLALKADIVVDAFTRIARVALGRPIAVAESPERGYRMRARFHVRGHRVGFYRESTHELCDAASSGQLQPNAVEAVRALGELLAQDERTDDVLGIELAENIAGDGRAIHVELRDGRSADRLAAGSARSDLTGLSWSVPSDAGTHVVSGTPYVIDGLDIRPLGGGEPPSRGFGEPGPTSKNEGRPIRIRRHVRAFFQSNRYLLSELVQHVLALVPDGGPVIDLYAGVGLFAVSLACTRRNEVIAVEGDAISAADLAANAASCERPFLSQHSSVERFLRRSKELSLHTVMLDPPRTGLSREAASGLHLSRPRRIVYVSCDVATLARDVKDFLREGYRLEHVEAFDLFPNTPHIETIAVLDRI